MAWANGEPQGWNKFEQLLELLDNEVLLRELASGIRDEELNRQCDAIARCYDIELQEG